MTDERDIAPTTADVVMTFQTSPEIAPLSVEDTMWQVLQVVETEAADIALGAVVACDYDERSIELAFTIEAASDADVHRRLSDVVAIIATHAGMNVSPARTTTQAPAPVLA